MRLHLLRALAVVAVVVAAAPPARAATEPTDPVGRYNLACKRALDGDRDGAFAMLDKAIAVGFGSADVMEKDPDLASLRGDARWSAAVTRARANANPCKSLPEARQLDFWVGEWDVRDPKGRLVGRSSIQLILNDCVVLENWTGTLGGSGKSMNFWDKGNRRWQQTWIDDRGGVQQFLGHLVGKSLVYMNGDARRLTFTPLDGGRVRQLSELTSDGGKSWTVGYDFTYSKRR